MTITCPRLGIDATGQLHYGPQVILYVETPRPHYYDYRNFDQLFVWFAQVDHPDITNDIRKLMLMLKEYHVKYNFLTQKQFEMMKFYYFRVQNQYSHFLKTNP